MFKTCGGNTASTSGVYDMEKKSHTLWIPPQRMCTKRPTGESRLEEMYEGLNGRGRGEGVSYKHAIFQSFWAYSTQNGFAEKSTLNDGAGPRESTCPQIGQHPPKQKGE